MTRQETLSAVLCVLMTDGQFPTYDACLSLPPSHGPHPILLKVLLFPEERGGRAPHQSEEAEDGGDAMIHLAVCVFWGERRFFGCQV